MYTRIISRRYDVLITHNILLMVTTTRVSVVPYESCPNPITSPRTTDYYKHNTYRLYYIRHTQDTYIV